MSETKVRASVEIEGWRAIGRGATVGVIEKLHLPSGIILHGCLVLQGERGVWISLPSKPRIGADGQQALGKDGRKIYGPCVSFQDKDRKDRFSDTVIAALREAYPKALTG